MPVVRVVPMRMARATARDRGRMARRRGRDGRRAFRLSLVTAWVLGTVRLVRLVRVRGLVRLVRVLMLVLVLVLVGPLMGS